MLFEPIFALVILGLLVGLPLAIGFARHRSRSIHKGALIIAGLHCLMSLALALLAIATAYPSAASGASGPGIIGYLFFILQAPIFLLSKLDENLPLTVFQVLIPSTSVMYGYAIAYLFRCPWRNRGPDKV